MTILDSAHQGRDKIAILGDLLIDETYYVKPTKISPEAPILVCNLLSNGCIKTPGGAGLAASYAAKHTIPHLLLSLIEDKNEVFLSVKEINFYNLQHAQNISKIRYIDKTSDYQLLRIDNDDIVLENSKVDHLLVLDRVKQQLLSNKIGVLACLDYRKGLFCHSFSKELIQFCKENKIKVYVDSRGDISQFKNVDTLKLNNKEYLAAIAALNINSPFDLIKLLNLQKVIITRGRDGASVYWDENKEFHKSAGAVDGIPDPTGCGDVFDINFCYYYYLEHFKIKEAMMSSVYAASKYAHTSIETRLK